MLKLMKKRLKNEKGLTLVEVLAVVVILAIIAAIAIPAIGNLIENSRIKAAKSDAINILNAANIYKTDVSGVTKVTLTAATDAESAKYSYEPDTITEDFGNYVETIGSFDGFVIEFGPTITIDGTVKLASGTTIQFNKASISDIDASSPTDDSNLVDVEK